MTPTLGYLDEAISQSQAQEIKFYPDEETVILHGEGSLDDLSSKRTRSPDYSEQNEIKDYRKSFC